MTDCPEVHSNGFHIKFDASSDSTGYILPHWLGKDERTDVDAQVKGLDLKHERWVLHSIPQGLTLRFQTMGPKRSLDKNKWSKTGFLVIIHNNLGPMS